MELHLSYNPSFFTILEVAPVDMLLDSALFFYKDLTYGEGEIRIIAGANNFAIDGTGAVAKFTFLPILSGLSSVSILDSTQLRNSINDPITILTERNGLIEVN